MIDFAFLKLLQELVVGLHLLGSRHEHLLHHLLDHVVLLPDVRVLTLHLSFELLVRDCHLIDLLLQLDLLLVEAFLVSVLHAIRHVGLLVLVLLGLLIGEVRNTLQVLCRLQLVPCGRLRPCSLPLAKWRLHERRLLTEAVRTGVPLSANLSVLRLSWRALAYQGVHERKRLLVRIGYLIRLVRVLVSLP